MKQIPKLMQRFLPLVIALVLVSCYPVKKYQDLSEVLSWENDIRKFEELDKSVEFPKDAILFAGSSSIRLWIPRFSG